MARVTRHTSPVTRHPTHVTRLKSPDTYHASPVTRRTSPTTLHQRLEAAKNVRPTHSTTEKTEVRPPQRGKKTRSRLATRKTAPNCVHPRLLPHEFRASIQSSHPPLPHPYLGNFPTVMLVSEERWNARGSAFCKLLQRPRYGQSEVRRIARKYPD